jgi:hypothetical protein
MNGMEKTVEQKINKMEGSKEEIKPNSFNFRKMLLGKREISKKLKEIILRNVQDGL